MAVHGYITHAAANRRKLWWLICSYITAFEIIGALALTFVLLFVDPQHTILTDPLGYALRYALPVAIFAALLFRVFYHGHMKHVVRRLSITILKSAEESDPNAARFVRIAEQQCTVFGIKLPKFGIIEAPQLNALSVGTTPDAGLIAVTRGLLVSLDDDELEAVLAHEAAHIRNGDTKILAANHALMRTSVQLQVNNAFRADHLSHALLILALPVLLPIFIAGSAATMLAMQMSFQARRGISLTRDLIADGEAVRSTHYPAALLSALKKTAARSEFKGSDHFATLLFCGTTHSAEEKHLYLGQRIKAISALGANLMIEERARRDTRAAHERSLFQPAIGANQTVTKSDRNAVSAPPPAPKLLDIFVRPKCWTKWYSQTVDYNEWKEGEKRNRFGLKAQMHIPLATVTAFLLVFHWPTNGDYAGTIQLFNPASLVKMVGPDAETFCSVNQKTTGRQCGSGSLTTPFQGVSAEVAGRQGLLSVLVLGFILISMQIPGVRDWLYPQIDWSKRSQKTSKNIFAMKLTAWSSDDHAGKPLEDETKPDDNGTSLGTDFNENPSFQMVSPGSGQKPRSNFGRKGV